MEDKKQLVVRYHIESVDYDAMQTLKYLALVLSTINGKRVNQGQVVAEAIRQYKASLSEEIKKYEDFMKGVDNRDNTTYHDINDGD